MIDYIDKLIARYGHQIKNLEGLKRAMISEHQKLAGGAPLPLSFNRTEYKRLESLWKAAVERGDDTFVYNRCTIVTDYAKYMLEYLEPLLFDREKNHGR